MLDHWVREFWILGGLVFLGVVVGALSGHYALGILLFLAPYIAYHLYNLYRLDEWLRVRKFSELPEDVNGIYEELFHAVFSLQKRGRTQKRRLTDLLSRFREATSAMPDATVVLRPQGEIEWFNTAASRLLSLRPQDVGHRIDNLFRNPRFVNYLSKREYGVPLTLESPSDARLTLHIHIVPYGDNQRLLIARDVTRMQRLEQVRRDFVANVSHELRTPLTVLSGFLETMAEGPEHGGPWARQLGLMRAQAARMQLIVEQLLLLSRLEMEVGPPRREPVNVPAMLQSIRDEATVLSGDKKHVINMQSDDELWLQGNPEELRSAMSNLVFNAVQYTPANGQISIVWERHNGGARFTVSDTGIGIPAHHIPRLTERFYRVDVSRSREVGGTGLGLAIVKHVLQRHDGMLTIQSEIGKGSTFICDFGTAVVAPPGGAKH